MLILCSCQALPQAPSSTSIPINRQPIGQHACGTLRRRCDQRRRGRLKFESLTPSNSLSSWRLPAYSRMPQLQWRGRNAVRVPSHAWSVHRTSTCATAATSACPPRSAPTGRVDGLEQEDAIAHYDTVDGRVVVTPSNRVCIYAPRFAAVRRVENLLAHERRQLVDLAIDETAPSSAGEMQPVVTSTQRRGVAINLGERPAILFRARQQAAESVSLVKPAEFYNTLGPYANLTIIRTGQIDGSEQAIVKRSVQAAVAWNGDQAAQVVFSNQQAVAVVGLKQPGCVYQTDEPGDPRSATRQARFDGQRAAG